MSIGILLTGISAVALALTVTTDKLMVGDFYENDPMNPWFISSLFGGVLGLVATWLAWLLLAKPGLQETMHQMFSNESVYLLIGMFVVGVLVSVNLRFYFGMFSKHAYTTVVAMAIAATPVLVFVLQNLITGAGWTFWTVSSVLITTSALIGFEVVGTHDSDSDSSGFNWYLVGFLLISTVYLVALEYILSFVEVVSGYDGVQSSLLTMPFFWAGFSIGIFAFLKKSVRKFLKKVFSRWHFLLVALLLEIIGASFYFFEFFGISELSVALVTLITGAHIVVVWLLDIYIRKKYLFAQKTGLLETKVLFFSLPTKNLGAYDITVRTLMVQGVFILMVICGIVIWPL
jgi:hypothetical protein